MEEWISVEHRLPECNRRIEDCLYHSKRIITYSYSHGIQFDYLRLDDEYADRLLVTKQKGMTHKWGLSGDDKTITHWRPMIESPLETTRIPIKESDVTRIDSGFEHEHHASSSPLDLPKF